MVCIMVNITEAKRRNLNCKPENEDKTNSSDKVTNKTEKAENKCKELGFTPATESYGNCVLKLMVVYLGVISNTYNRL